MDLKEDQKKTGGVLIPTIRIPFGPQHPALKESINFTFEVDGERVVSVRPRLGYVHRGIEKLAEDRTYIQNIHLVERVCGLCSQAHVICYSQAVEEILGVEAPARARYMRVIMAELERIQNHYMWLGVTAREMGFDTLFMYTWRDREIVMNVVEAITGKRVNYGINTIGGMRRNLTPKLTSLMMKGLDRLEERTKYYRRLCMTEPTILRRTVGVGILSPKDALGLCAVGPTLRASGIKRDIRADDPYAAYEEVPFDVITYDGCDVASRLKVRCDELLESIGMIRYALNSLPEGDVRVKVPGNVPEGESVSRVEAPRGEDIHYVKADGTDKPARLKIRAPTLANILPLCKMFAGMNIADIPMIIAGIDPCIACADRVAFIDTGKGDYWTWSGDELRRYSTKWCKRK
jgi:membrane-bound hydrogenase subunit alpha